MSHRDLCHPDGRPKIAPVQGYSAGIPWSLHLRAYDAYCAKYQPQEALIDLEGHGCRGGFGTRELDMFVPGWRDEVSEITALRKEIADLRAKFPETDCPPINEKWRPITEAIAGWEVENGTITALLPDEYEPFLDRLRRAASGRDRSEAPTFSHDDRELAIRMCELTGWANVAKRLRQGWVPDPLTVEGQILSEITEFRLEQRR